MDNSTDISGAESHDSLVVGSARRVPIKLPEFAPDVDVNQVELEMIEEEPEVPPTHPVQIRTYQQPAPSKPPPVRKSNRTSKKVKLYLVCYFACCLCLCKKRGQATNAVIPSVASKYRITDDRPYD